MSLVKASILHELEFSLNIKRWLLSKRENHHQIATNNYCSRIRQLFRANLKRQQRERVKSLLPNRNATKLTKSGLVVIRLGDETTTYDTPGKHQKLPGICIDRCNFPEIGRAHV